MVAGFQIIYFSKKNIFLGDKECRSWSSVLLAKCIAGIIICLSIDKQPFLKLIVISSRGVTLAQLTSRNAIQDGGPHDVILI